MRTYVRDFAALGLRPLPPRARLAERDRRLRDRDRARLREPSRGARARPPGGRRSATVPPGYCAEVSDVGFEEAQVVLACLAGLVGASAEAAAEALAALFHRRGSKQAGEALLRWAR